MPRHRSFQKAGRQAPTVWLRAPAGRLALAWEPGPASCYRRLNWSCCPTQGEGQELLLWSHSRWLCGEVVLSSNPLFPFNLMIPLSIHEAGTCIAKQTAANLAAQAAYSTLLTFPLVKVTFMSW
jgi:hypothetical protein